MRIGEMTQGNQNQYLELLKSLNKKGALASKNSNTISGALSDDQSARYADRFTPAPEIKFARPDWNKIPTKKTPAMSEDAFVDAIRELAKKNYAEGNIGGKEYESLASNYIKAASPDRKAIYENSMAQTGGYMNKGQSFW
jgi:hypothetical protein